MSSLSPWSALKLRAGSALGCRCGAAIKDQYACVSAQPELYRIFDICSRFLYGVFFLVFYCIGWTVSQEQTVLLGVPLWVFPLLYCGIIWTEGLVHASTGPIKWSENSLCSVVVLLHFCFATSITCLPFFQSTTRQPFSTPVVRLVANASIVLSGSAFLPQYQLGFRIAKDVEIPKFDVYKNVLGQSVFRLFRFMDSYTEARPLHALAHFFRHQTLCCCATAHTAGSVNAARHAK